MASQLKRPAWDTIEASLPAKQLIDKLKSVWEIINEHNILDLQPADAADYHELGLRLASDGFTFHDSKDVRILVACCLIELYKLHCPSSPFINAPHEPSLILCTLKFFYRTAANLRRLKNKNSPSLDTLVYFTRSLIETDLILVCQDNPDAGEAVFEFFKCMLSITNNLSVWSWEESDERMLYVLVDSMSKVVEEAFSLINFSSLSLVLEYLVRPKKEQEPKSHSLALQFLLSNATHLEMLIHKLLQEALALSAEEDSDHSDLEESDDDEPEVKPKRERTLNFKRDLLLLIIYELHTLNRSFVSPVLPMLELRLRARSERQRKRACRLLGKLFGENNGFLVEQQPQLWSAFIGRCNDVSASVRSVCVDAVCHLIRNNRELRACLAPILRSRSVDPEEAIRDRVIQFVAELAKSELDSSPDDLVTILVDRSIDKRQSVRRAAIAGLCDVYSAYVSQSHLWLSGSTDSEYCAVNCLNSVMRAYSIGDWGDKIAIEHQFKSFIVPYTMESSERMRLFLWCFCSFNSASTKAFVEMLKTEYHVVQLCCEIVQMLGTQSSSAQSQTWLSTKSSTLSTYFPHPEKAAQHLNKFFASVQSKHQLKQLLFSLLDKSNGCSKTAETLRRMLRRQEVSQPKRKREADPSAGFNYVVTSLLKRASSVLFDSESVTLLISMIDNELGSQSKGLQLINVLSFYLPHVINADSVSGYVATCLVSLAGESGDSEPIEICLRIVQNCGERLANCQAAERILAPIADLSVGPDARLARLAARCLLALRAGQVRDEADARIRGIVASACEADASDVVGAAAKVAAFGQVLKSMALTYCEEGEAFVSDKLIPFVTLNDQKVKGRKCGSSLATWTPDESLTPLTKLKLCSMRCLCQYMIGSLTADSELAARVFDLLLDVVLTDGDASKSGRVETGEMSQMRLCAGKCLLRIAKRKVYAKLFNANCMQTVSCLVCDPCSLVRVGFLEKLHRGLIKFKLSIEFMAFFAYVPEASGGSWVAYQRNARLKLQQNVSRRRQFLASNKQQVAADYKIFFSLLPEHCLAYAVHLLARDPDFDSINSLSQLSRLKANLRFLMEPMLTKADNFSWLRRMMEKIRAASDALDPDCPEAGRRLHAVADLSLGLLVTKSAKFTICDYPFEPQLPSSLYVLLRSVASSAKPEFSGLPESFKFTPPRCAKAVEQGLIPKKRLRSRARGRRREDNEEADDAEEPEEEEKENEVARKKATLDNAVDIDEGVDDEPVRAEKSPTSLPAGGNKEAGSRLRQRLPF